MTAWMGLESIMLNEISQVVKDKYRMISPISGNLSTKQTTKQNITRDIEIKNKLAVTREGKDNGVKWRKGHQGTCIKDTWTKPKGVGLRLGGGDGWGGGMGLGENGDNFT